MSQRRWQKTNSVLRKCSKCPMNFTSHLDFPAVTWVIRTRLWLRNPRKLSLVTRQLGTSVMAKISELKCARKLIWKTSSWCITRWATLCNFNLHHLCCCSLIISRFPQVLLVVQRQTTYLPQWSQPRLPWSCGRHNRAFCFNTSASSNRWTAGKLRWQWSW